MLNTLVYTAEGHPTADRLYRLRKRNKTNGPAFRNLNVYTPGQTEECRMVLVADLDHPVAQEYLDRGFVLDARKNRKDELPAEKILRVLRPRTGKGTEVVIDLDSDEARKQASTEYMSRNNPITREGKEASAKAKAKKNKLNGPKRKTAAS